MPWGLGVLGGRIKGTLIKRDGRYLNPANPLKNQGIYPAMLPFYLEPKTVRSLAQHVKHEGL